MLLLLIRLLQLTLLQMLLLDHNLAFSVTASDADVGDTLSYAWYLDSVLQGSTSASYTYSSPSGTSHTIRVDVTDGKDTRSQTWTVAVNTPNNNAPVIDSFTPTDTTPDVTAGSNLAFSVTASDADAGDTLTYAWYLDSVLQGSTSASYTYSSASGTTHTVRVDVSDGTDTVSNSWTVTVNADTTMHVDSIVMSVVPRNGGNERGQAIVTVVDSSGNPVPDATVYSSWTISGGHYGGTDTDITDSNGEASVHSQRRWLWLSYIHGDHN